MMEGVGLIFILGALLGVHSQSLQVSQIPLVNAKEGDSVTLECNYTINSSNNETIGWYKWYRHLLHGDEVSNTTGYYKGRVSMASPSDFIEKASASITLHNVSIADTGKYICEVNINEIISGHGNGTFLNVTELDGFIHISVSIASIVKYVRFTSGVLAVGVLLIVLLCHYK